MKSRPDQVFGKKFFVKIVNGSITLLYLQEFPSWAFKYALPVSATAISLTYDCL